MLVVEQKSILYALLESTHRASKWRPTRGADGQRVKSVESGVCVRVREVTSAILGLTAKRSLLKYLVSST